MKESNASSPGGVTRRGFVIGAGALGVAVGCAGMTSVDGWLVPKASADEGAEEKVAYTYHQGHCTGRCSLQCTVRDGRLVCIEPNSALSERRYKTMCLKGVSEVQHIYSDHRIQTPLKRTGERGANEFMPVSWDEALDDIVAQIKDIQKKHGTDSVLVTTCAEADVPWLSTILQARTCANNNGIDIGIGNGMDVATGLGYGYGMSAPESRDWVNARLVIHCGNNYCETSLPTARNMFEAQEAGTRFVTIDPNFSTTASKSDEWIPIEPGSDPALFLGMTTHILDNGLADEEFMAAHTSLPFLVDAKTGKLLRSKDGVTDEEAKKEAEEAGEAYEPYFPFLVVDADGAVKSHLQASAPKLDATATVEGASATTAYNLLVENQKNYPTSWASEMTSIPQAKIEELAEEYAKGPSCLSLGWGGADKMTTGDITGHAIAVLTAVTGNIGKPGAGMGIYLGGADNGYSCGLGEWAIPEKFELAPGAADLQMREIREGDEVHALFAVGDVSAQKVATMSKTEEWLKTLDLVVSADAYFTEGCKWADYVLPLTTRFEYDEEVGNVKVGWNHIALQEQVLEPLFEAKTDLWLQRELASRLGYEGALPKTAAERVEAIMAGCTEKVTLAQIKENQGVWPISGIEQPRPALVDYGFPTESGTMQVYYDDMVDFGQELPNWETNLEVYPDNPAREQYPLQLLNTKTRFRIHNQFNDSAWLAQYYQPTAHANPADLAAAGVKSGDTVRIVNDRGSCKVPVVANEAIRPGVIRLYEAATADYTAEGNMQYLTNGEVIERGSALAMGPVIPFNDTIVRIEKA